MDNALVGSEDLDAIEKGLNGDNDQVMPNPFAQFKKAIEWYKPDDEAYAPLENNEINTFVQEAAGGRIQMEVHGLSENGIPYCASLNTDQVREAFSDESNLDSVIREHFIKLRETGNLYTRSDADIKLRESRSLREDDGFASVGGYDYFGQDPNSLGQFDGNQEFLPLGNAPYNRQLYIHDQWDMQAKAFYARTHDPVAKRALTLIVDFTLGRAVKMVAASPTIQKYLEQFDKLNKFNRRLPVWIEDQACDGELFFRFFETDEGPPKITSVDPSSIWEIVTDPENIDDVKFYWQQYQTAYQLIGNASIDSDVPEKDKKNQTCKYVIRFIPADRILHFKINASAVEKRGRSDLFPVLGWLQRLRKYYDAETVKSLMQAAFVFDILLKGGANDASSVKQFSSQVPPPDVTQPGSAFYHNEGVEIQLLQGNKSAANSTGSIGIGDGLLGIIAVGLGFAKDYLGVTSRGSRATALVSTEPSAKHFESRQRVIKYMLEDVAEYVVDYGIKKGEIPLTEVIPAKKEWRKVLGLLFTSLRNFDFKEAVKIILQAQKGAVEQPIDRSVAFIFPDIVKADRTELISDIKSAEGMNYFSKRRAAEMVAAAFEVDDYNFEEEQEDIREESIQVVSKDQEQVKKGLPDENDAAFDPGDVPNPAKAPTTGTNGKSQNSNGSSEQKSSNNNGGTSHAKDNPQGSKGSGDIRKDLGPQNKESIRILIK